MRRRKYRNNISPSSVFLRTLQSIGRIVVRPMADLWFYGVICDGGIIKLPQSDGTQDGFLRTGWLLL